MYIYLTKVLSHHMPVLQMTFNLEICLFPCLYAEPYAVYSGFIEYTIWLEITKIYASIFIFNPRRTCAARVTVLSHVCLLSHI